MNKKYYQAWQKARYRDVLTGWYGRDGVRAFSVAQGAEQRQ